MARNYQPINTGTGYFVSTIFCVLQIHAMVGHSIHPDEPLMAAGVDSRAAMELRRTLGNSLGLTLPVTLLYDFQTVNAVVGYIANEVLPNATTAPAAQDDNIWTEDELESVLGTSVRRTATAPEDASKPSALVKALRGAPAPRPLFLAAPGVANAQSAYFAFSKFLNWSDQPIYVLEKDNDLSIAELAQINASDIIKIQLEGPYLVGGHSYGGAVAVEIAMVLENWGYDVGLVLVSSICLGPPVNC